MEPSGARFIEVDYAEPHRSRSLEILRRHPEVRALFGRNPATALYVLAAVVFQVAMAWALRGAPWWEVLVAAWCVGAFATHLSFCLSLGAIVAVGRFLICPRSAGQDELRHRGSLRGFHDASSWRNVRLLICRTRTLDQNTRQMNDRRSSSKRRVHTAGIVVGDLGQAAALAQQGPDLVRGTIGTDHGD